MRVVVTIQRRLAQPRPRKPGLVVKFTSSSQFTNPADSVGMKAAMPAANTIRKSASQSRGGGAGVGRAPDGSEPITGE
jgi:hypothetical protein